MVHVIKTAIYAFLLVMPLITCLWLLASARTIGRQQKSSKELDVAPAASPDIASPIVKKDVPNTREPDQSPNIATLGIPSMNKKRRLSISTSSTPKPKPLSAMFQAIPHSNITQQPFSVSTTSLQDRSPPALPNKRRYSLGSDQTKDSSKKLPSPPSRKRSNSYSESKSQSSSKLLSLNSATQPSLHTSPLTSLEGIHERILAVYLDLYLTYGSSFADDRIRQVIFTHQKTYLNILKNSGQIDATIADVCETLILDSEKVLASHTSTSHTHKNNAMFNFYRGMGLLWVAIVLPREKNTQPSGYSVEELAAIFFQTVGDINLRHHSIKADSSGNSARICLNGATTMLFESLSMLCASDSEAIKLVTPENIRWSYPIKINQATAELLSLRYKTPDLSDKMAQQTLQSVVDKHFSGLSNTDQHAVMQRVNTDFIAEYDGHLSVEVVKSTLKNLNAHAEYITLNHPDIGKLYEQVQFRQAYIFAVRSETARFITDSFDEQKHGQPDLNKIQYLHKILSVPKFSTLTSADQIVILDQADIHLTERYQAQASTHELSSTLQTLRTYASSISIKHNDIKTLSQRLQLRLDYVTLVIEESARLLTNRYDRRTNTMPTYDKLLYLLINIKSNPIFNTLNLDDQTAVLDKVKTILTERFANSPLSGTLVTTLQQLCSDTSDISIACQDIESLYSQYIDWMPLSTHSPGP